MFTELYPMSKEISEKVDKLINDFVVSEGDFTEGIISLEEMTHLYLLKQLSRNLKKKVIVPVYYYKVLVEEEVNKSTLAFHAEHALMRVTSVWEHLFQILNTFLEINMSPRRVKETDEKWLIEKKSITIKKNISFKKYAKVSNQYLTRTSFLSNVKKKFIADPILREIVNLSNKPHWKKIREYRNDIIHHKFIGQSEFILDASHDNYIIQIENKAEEFFDYRELTVHLLAGLDDIKDGLEKSFLMLKQDLTPNKKLSSREDYFLLKIKCACDEKVKLVPDSAKELDDKLIKSKNEFRGIFCPKCFSDNVEIIEDKQKVSQKTWADNFNAYYYDKTPVYLEKKINDLNK
ncbi:hypothetical protein [Bacillus sp. T33-2]|uniref:hypothetical protein n=1 Tax=Bacillus sp. T33-2 TaxID=2054168 RepID=UPI000C78DA27|nr:hypothetical protein [Bacillus sp. T33-2]PLR95795.1 hypothetical protein CVD19_13785 [Bacillus sp. T33-2]